jgi:NADH:ubiquinone oxidoreductase subunit B-like Fe-S oxidoreductase
MALLKNQNRNYMMTMFIQIKCFGLSCCVAEYMVMNNAVLYLRRHNVCNTAVRISDLMSMFIF